MSVVLRTRSFAVLAFMLAAVLIAGMFAAAAPAQAMTREQRVLNAFQVVRNQMGDPYQYGAEGPSRFDCSGLLYYSFRKAGFTGIPRTSDQQAGFVDRIPRRRMHKGDFMFFYDGGGVYHVAMFAGWKDNRRTMIHAPYGSRRVHRTSPWTDQWFAGTIR